MLPLRIIKDFEQAVHRVHWSCSDEILLVKLCNFLPKQDRKFDIYLQLTNISKIYLI